MQIDQIGPRAAVTGMALLAALFLPEACSRSDPAVDADPGPGSPPVSLPEPEEYGHRVVTSYPHDSQAFTQGLAYADGYLYEGTGLYGQSEIRRVDLETGTVLQSTSLSDSYFGEGITVLGQRLYQLTWRNGVGFVYALESFARQDTFAFPHEGWGLTDDGTRLIASDGTAMLYFLDPQSLRITGSVTVHDQRGPVEDLNELEWVAGEILANVWQSDRVARISPIDGQVTGWIDLSGLLSPSEREQPVDVLNGIAYDAELRRLFVTGKLWPRIFQIELVPRR